MTYKEALEKIDELNRFGSRLGLERMGVLMDYLGNPQDRLRIIHVAGTNGKGSVCRYTNSVLRACGYKVGLYTSPFLEHFTERIEWEGRTISEEELVHCTETVFAQVDRMVAEGMNSPTEFEVVTAMALLYFSQKETDFVILEVGLGGRGDSTNVVAHPLVCAITSISFDHMQYLGNTLPAIATEKAGILKEQVPMVCCIKDKEALETVRRLANEKQSPFIEVDLSQVEVLQTSIDCSAFATTVLGQSYPRVEISMLGMHQIENAVVALTLLEVLCRDGHVVLDRAKVQKGMKEAVQTGRLEILARNPYWIIDGAHNRAGVEMLERTVTEHFQGKKILLLIGVLADKEVDEMVGWFGKIGGDLVATEPESPRKLSAQQLCEAVCRQGFSCEAVGDASHAIAFAKAQQMNYDVIIFAGSLYLIGKIRELWNHEK